MSCNRCADQAQAAMRAAGVPARQTQATWAGDQCPAQCSACGAFLTKQGQCLNSACNQGPVTQTSSSNLKNAPGNITERDALLPALTSFNPDEMPLETVRQIKNELENIFQTGMNAIHEVVTQKWAMRAEFNAKYPGYKPDFILGIGRTGLTLPGSGPPEADEEYRQWSAESKRLMRNVTLSVQAKWRHRLKHLFQFETDNLTSNRFRLIDTDFIVSVEKRPFKAGLRNVWVYSGDERLEWFTTELGKSGGWLESLRRLVGRRLKDEENEL